MAPALCAVCTQSRAVLVRPKDGQRLCKTCFVSAFERETHATITAHGLFDGGAGERVAIGASGGKDSTVLAHVLATLNARHGYGLDLVLLSVDEGIAGYRDDSLATVRRNAARSGLPLRVVSYADLYGWTMDDVVAATGARRGSCTYCGVFRRQALDRGARAVGARHVVTGHNADDVAETVLMNLLRGDLPRLGRAAGIVTGKGTAEEVKRSKPLMFAYEKEIVLYAHHMGLEYFCTECVYSPEAFRGTARTLVKRLEKVRPSAILDIVRSGMDMAKLVPREVAGGCGRAAAAAAAAAAEREAEEEGCGSAANGRSSGGEMAAMEKVLRANEEAGTRETEIVEAPRPPPPPPTSRSTAGQPPPARGKRKERKLPTQRMGRCERCGYLSSQAVCKACVLLEGLNKNRPKVEICVATEEGEGKGVEREGNGPALTPRMEGLALAGY